MLTPLLILQVLAVIAVGVLWAIFSQWEPNRKQRSARILWGLCLVLLLIAMTVVAAWIAITHVLK